MAKATARASARTPHVEALQTQAVSRSSQISQRTFGALSKKDKIR